MPDYWKILQESAPREPENNEVDELLKKYLPEEEFINPVYPNDPQKRAKQIDESNKVRESMRIGQPGPIESQSLEHKEKVEGITKGLKDVIQQGSPYVERPEARQERVTDYLKESGAYKDDMKAGLAGKTIEENPGMINYFSMLEDPKEKKEEKTGFGKAMGSGFLKGSAELGKGIGKLPSTIYRLAAAPQNLVADITGWESLEAAPPEWLENNPLSDYYSEQVDTWSKNTKEYEKSIGEQLKKGDIGGALKSVGVQVAETLPLTMSLMAGGASGAAGASGIGIGLYSTGMKFEQLDEDMPDMKEWLKVYNAVLTGTGEALSERLGSINIGKMGRELLEKAGTQKLKQVAKDSFIKTVGEKMKNYSLNSAMIEGLEEAGAQFSENLVDKVTGVDPDRSLMSGVFDATVIGFAAGGVTTGPIQVTANVANKVQDRKNTRLIQEHYNALGDELTHKGTGEVIEAVYNAGEEQVPLYVVNDIDEQTAAVIDARTGHKTIMAKKDLEVVGTTPSNQWKAEKIDAAMQEYQGMRQQENLQQAADEVAAEEATGFRKDDQVKYEGQEYVISEVSPEGITITRESEEGLPEILTVTPNQLKPLREPVQEEGPKTVELGGAQYEYEETEDGYYIPGDEKQSKAIRSEVDTENFEVEDVTEEIPIENAPEFAKKKTETIHKGVRIKRKQPVQKEQMSTEHGQDVQQKEAFTETEQEKKSEQDLLEVPRQMISEVGSLEEFRNSISDVEWEAVRKQYDKKLDDQEVFEAFMSDQMEDKPSEGRKFAEKEKAYLPYEDAEQLETRSKLADDIIDFLNNTTYEGETIEINEKDGRFTGTNVINLLGESKINSQADIDRIKEKAQEIKKELDGEIDQREDEPEGNIIYGRKAYKDEAELKSDLKNIDDLGKLPESFDYTVMKVMDEIQAEREGRLTVPQIRQIEETLRTLPEEVKAEMGQYFSDGKLNREELLNFLNNSPNHFKGKPYDLTDEEINNLKEIFSDEKRAAQAQRQLEKYASIATPGKVSETSGKSKGQEEGRGDKGHSQQGEQKPKKQSVSRGLKKPSKPTEKPTKKRDKLESVQQDKPDSVKPVTVKAEKKSTDSAQEVEKKSEKRQKPEKEPKQPKITKQKRIDLHNRLVELVRDFNKIPKNHTNKRADAQKQIGNLAKRLGYNTGTEKGELVVFDKEKNIKTIPVKQPKEDIQAHKALKDYPEETKGFIQDMIDMNPNMFGVYLPLSQKQKESAVKNILEGKRTVASNTLLDELEAFYNQGEITLLDPTTKEKINVPIDDVLKSIQDTPESLDNYSYLDYDLAYQNKLISKQERDEVQRYIQSEQERESEAERNFIEDSYRDNESDKETQKELTPSQQAALDKRLKEIDEEISKQEDRIKKAEKTKSKELNKANDRNGLFGDTKRDYDERFAGSFLANNETVKKLLAKYDGEIRDAEKEITRLKKLREDTIKSAGDQGDMFGVNEKTGDYTKQSRTKLHKNNYVYETENGEKISYQLAFDFNKQTEPNNLRKKESRDTNPSLRRLKKGEYSVVERKYRANKQFSFIGDEKIESYDDVAFLFKNLEDQAVENVFFVLVKDGKPMIHYHSTGSPFASIIHINALSDAVNRFKPDSIYLVHNHPSGNINPSQGDFNIHSRLQKAFPELIKAGVIINIKTGKYSTFYGNDLTFEEHVRPHEPKRRPKEYRVLNFDKQVFNENINQPKIGSSKDIASLLSAQRFSSGEKLGLFVLSRQNKINANILLPYSDMSEDAIADDIAAYVSRFAGTTAILYGRFDIDTRSNRLKGLLADRDVTLLDAVSFKSYDNYKSAADEGVMEEQKGYDLNKNPRRSSIKEGDSFRNKLIDRLIYIDTIFALEGLELEIDSNNNVFVYSKDGKPVDNVPESLYKLAEEYGDLMYARNAFRLRQRRGGDLGLYSNTAQALFQISQNKATPEQWKAMLLKNGSKEAELNWIGWTDFVSDKKSLTKDEISQFVRNNMVQLEEVRKGEMTQEDYYDQYALKITGKRYSELNREEQLAIEEEYESDMENAGRTMYMPEKAKFEQWATSGARNYKELLLTMPVKQYSERIEYKKDEFGEWYAYVDGVSISGDYGYKSLQELKDTIDHGTDSEVKSDGSLESEQFKSTHFDEPNIVVHTRISDFTTKDGKKALHIDEIQSDFSQSLRTEKNKLKEMLENNFEETYKRLEAAGIVKRIC